MSDSHLARLRARNARAARTAKHHPDDPQALAERAAAELDYREAKLAAAIAAEVDKAPPLTTEQRTRLAALLQPALTGTARPSQGSAA